MNSTLKAPFPWFGGKSRVASVVWERFGDVDAYAEPFFGSGAVLLNRPGWKPDVKWVETVNDLDGFVANAWRAIAAKPDEVAEWADWPINENDLHARHVWLVSERDSLQARLEGDPDFCDPKIAGWWLWGIACWIGSGWCSGNGPWGSVEIDGVKQLAAGRGIRRQRPHLGDTGQGVKRQLPHLMNPTGMGANTRRDGLVAWMNDLALRFDRVRVCSGDWSRILQPSCFGGKRVKGVFLDPPYADEADRTGDLYARDSGSVAHDVREWCLEHGDDHDKRIALCGYIGEGHDMLTDHGWTAHHWTAPTGYAGQSDDPNKNRHKEVIWFSPHCREPGLSLLDM